MDQLTAAYQRQLKATRNMVGGLVVDRWRGLQSYNEADVPKFLEQVVPIVSAGQARAVALTSAYLARKLHRAPVGLDVALAQGANVRKGTPPEVVYKRPFIRVWASLKDNGDHEAAVTEGQNTAESNSLMDVALATMTALVLFGSDDSNEVVAWRRVAEPSCCEFCQMLDGVHTGPNQPQPLHNRCGCTAEPITRDSAGAEIAPGSTVEDVTIHEHGELGPVITQHGDHFTSEAQIPELSA